MHNHEKTSITVDTAHANDAEQILNLFYQTWLKTYPSEDAGITENDIKDHYKEKLTEEGLGKFKDRVGSYESFKDKNYLVAKVGDMVVGACRISVNEERNNLDALYVLPEYQDLGIGSMLFENAKSFFDPTKDVFVQVAKYNEKAINFYRRLGFRDGQGEEGGKGMTLSNGKTIPNIEMKMSRQ